MRLPFVVALAIALTPAFARADGPGKVLVIPADGEMPKPLADCPAKVTDAIADVAKAHAKSVEISASSRADVLLLAGCEQDAPGCLGSLTDTLDVDTVVLITVAPADRGAFVDVDVVKSGGKEPGHTSWVIDGKTTAAIVGEVTRQAPALFGAAAATRPPEPAPPAVVEPQPPKPTVDEQPPPGVPVATTTAAERAAHTDNGLALSRVKLYSWLTAGAGVALIGAGSVFFVRAGDKQAMIDDFDPQTGDDFRELQQIEDDAASQALLGNLLVGAGIAAVGVGTTLIILQLRSGHDDSVAAAPVIFDHGIGVAVTVVGDP